MEVFSILEKVEAISSRKEKEKILGEALKGDLGKDLLKLLQFSLDPYTMFGVIPKEEESDPKRSPPSMEEFFKTLEDLSKKIITGDKAKEAVQNLVTTNNSQWNKWILRIISKDLRIGAAGKTINKAAGENFIKEFALALCDKYDPNEEGAENTRSIFGDNFIIEPKYDGWRGVAHRTKNGIFFYTRAGKPICNTRLIEEQLMDIPFIGEDLVFDGELIADDFSKTESILSSSVSELEEASIKSLRFFIFDIIPADYFFSQGKTGTCPPLIKRKENLASMQSCFGDQLCLVPMQQFNSLDLSQHEMNLQLGYEGSILKEKLGLYEFKRTTGWVKVKPVLECDLTITGFEEGAGKYNGMLGTILAEGNVLGKDGGVPVKTGIGIGTGLSDELRKDIWNNKPQWLGAIIEVGYQALSKEKDSEVWSLRFPRFRKLRKDKVAA